jgi:hypothetical protein
MCRDTRLREFKLKCLQFIMMILFLPLFLKSVKSWSLSEDENLYLSFSKDCSKLFPKCLHRFSCRKVSFLKLGNCLWKLFYRGKNLDMSILSLSEKFITCFWNFQIEPNSKVFWHLQAAATNSQFQKHFSTFKSFNKFIL